MQKSQRRSTAKGIKVNENTVSDFRGRDLSRRCPDTGCPYSDTDTLPNYAIEPDSFPDQDMIHIQDYHPLC